MSNTATLLDACKKAASSKAFAEFGAKFGFSPVWMEGQDFRKLLDEEVKTFREIKEKFVDTQKQ